MRGILVSLVVSAFCLGALDASVSTWDKLQVTWGFDLLHAFYAQPSTVQDAVSQGYVKISDCDLTKPWRGARYVKDGDRAVILLFDVAGYIAGIQTALPNNITNGYPKTVLRPPFVQDGNNWLVTAYFSDPAKICTTGRTASEYAAEKVGNNLYIQQVASPEGSVKIPRNESGIKGTSFVEGKCFITMGKHYWYNISDDMSCDGFFPFFLLYNGGRLNGFGFAFPAPLESKFYEHPPSSSLSNFMVSVPKCLFQVGTISTMHVYLSEWALTNWC